MSYIEKCDLVAGRNGTRKLLDDSFERCLAREAERRACEDVAIEASFSGRSFSRSSSRHTSSHSPSGEWTREPRSRSFSTWGSKRKLPRVYSFKSSRPGLPDDSSSSTTSRSQTFHRSDFWQDEANHQAERRSCVKSRAVELSRDARAMALKCIAIPAVVLCDIIGSILS